MSAGNAGARSNSRLRRSPERRRSLKAPRPARSLIEHLASAHGPYARVRTKVPPWAKELGLCLIAAAATVYRIGTGTLAQGDQAPDGWAYGIGLAMAATLVARRRWPAVTLAVIDLLWTVYHVENYPGGAPAVPLWIALYSAATAERRWVTLPLAGWVIFSDVLGRTEYGRAGVFDAVLDGTTVVFVAMLLLGDAVRSRRGRRAEYEARLASLAAARDHVAAQRVAEERVRIARDVHDVSASTLTVISVQASLAAELLTEDPDEAGEALAVVRRAAREALGELRAAVGLLRDTGGGEAPAPGLDRLGDLARAYGGRGPRIEIRVDGEPRGLPRLVDVTAYRVVQEALANALRHGDPGLVEIVVRYGDGGLGVEVRDDGGAPLDADRGEGFGLRGMAERVAGLDGRLAAGPCGRPGTGERGFRVDVWLPWGGTHDDPRPAGG